MESALSAAAIIEVVGIATDLMKALEYVRHKEKEYTGFFEELKHEVESLQEVLAVIDCPGMLERLGESHNRLPKPHIASCDAGGGTVDLTCISPMIWVELRTTLDSVVQWCKDVSRLLKTPELAKSGRWYTRERKLQKLVSDAQLLRQNLSRFTREMAAEGLPELTWDAGMNDHRSLVAIAPGAISIHKFWVPPSDSGKTVVQPAKVLESAEARRVAFIQTQSSIAKVEDIDVIQEWTSKISNQHKPKHREAQWGSDLSDNAINMVNVKLELQPLVIADDYKTTYKNDHPTLSASGARNRRPRPWGVSVDNKPSLTYQICVPTVGGRDMELRHHMASEHASEAGLGTGVRKVYPSTLLDQWKNMQLTPKHETAGREYAAYALLGLFEPVTPSRQCILRLYDEIARHSLTSFGKLSQSITALREATVSSSNRRIWPSHWAPKLLASLASSPMLTTASLASCFAPLATAQTIEPGGHFTHHNALEDWQKVNHYSSHQHVQYQLTLPQTHHLPTSWLPDPGYPGPGWSISILVALLCELAVVLNLRPFDKYKGPAVGICSAAILLLCALCAEDVRQLVVLEWVGINLTLAVSAGVHAWMPASEEEEEEEGEGWKNDVKT